MFSKRFLPAVILSKAFTQLQTRSFVRAPFTNKLALYLRRAQLIDSIRLAVRSNSSNSLSSLLNDRLLDSFIVTHALRSAPNADSALSIMEALKSNPNFSHNQSTLHALATVLAKSQRNHELKTLIGDISSSKFLNVSVNFMNLMQWYSTSGDLELVLSTWNEYRQRAKLLSTESYNIVMSVYAKTGKNFEAVETFRQVIDEGAIPNSRTYTVMIEHLVNLGKLDSALEVFSALPLMRIKRTSKQYLILVEGFVGVERFDEAKSLLNEMRDDGKFPGRDMRVALERMQEMGFIEGTNEFLREMLPDKRIKNVRYYEDGSDDDEDENDDNNSGVRIAHGVRLKPWLDPKALANTLDEWSPEVVSLLPDAKFVWTTRLVCKVLRHFKSPETAWHFFCWVAYQPGYTHDVYALEKMLTILARHGHVELVDRLIAKLRSDGMRLPFSTIRLIIDFYGISKKADAASKVFHDDRTLCGPISKFKLMLLYSSLLRTLTKCKRDFDAINVLEEMIFSGIVPDVQTFSGLMYHFALQGDEKIVQKLFSMVRQNGVEPDAYMFKVLIQAYCKCGRAPLAYRVFEDLSNSNLMPDAATKELLKKSLWKEGRRKEAAAVEERCEKINDVPSLALRGHIWAVSSADLTRVHSIYRNRNSNSREEVEDVVDGSVLICHQCELKYHRKCLQNGATDKLKTHAKEKWFCSKKCEEIFLGLQRLLGKPIPIGVPNLTWTLVKFSQHDTCKLDATDIQTLSKLNIAHRVMHECFEPVHEPYSSGDLAEDVLFSRWSLLNRLNFQGFYTVLLERNEELVTVATVRIFGEKAAEIPLVGTRFQYRRLGMCRILMNELEKRLMELGVEKLILPAIPTVLKTWTTSFGFKRMTASERVQLVDYTFLNFPDTTMCLKLLQPSAELKISRDFLTWQFRGSQPGLESNVCENGDNIDLAGSSTVSEVSQAEQTEESETIEQRLADVAMKNYVTGNESSVHPIVMVKRPTCPRSKPQQTKITPECSVVDADFNKICMSRGSDVANCYKRRKISASGNRVFVPLSRLNKRPL